MISNDTIVKAQAEYDAAARAIKECKAGKLQGLENRYGLAYHALARTGVVLPLKKKHRTK